MLPEGSESTPQHRGDKKLCINDPRQNSRDVGATRTEYRNSTTRLTTTFPAGTYAHTSEATGALSVARWMCCGRSLKREHTHADTKHLQGRIHSELCCPRHRPRAALALRRLPVSTLHVRGVDLNGTLGRLAPLLLPNPAAVRASVVMGVDFVFFGDHLPGVRRFRGQNWKLTSCDTFVSALGET